MLAIRLQRIGRKHDPKFRVVVTEKARGPKSRQHIEVVGFYDAKTGERKINGERVKYWIGVGAKTSGTVHNFLVDDKVIGGKKINVLPKIKTNLKKVEESKEESDKEEGIEGNDTASKDKESESDINIDTKEKEGPEDKSSDYGSKENFEEKKE